MEPSREGPDDQREQRAARRRHIEAALARAYQHRDRAHAWNDARLRARYQAEIRRAEATLAAFDHLDAAAAAAEKSVEAQP